jgi:hypothetical protein
MTAENPPSSENASNGKQNTTLVIKKGTSIDVLKPRDLVEVGDDVKTVAQLRAFLVGKGITVESDQFTVKDGSLLKREEEGSTQWSGIVAEDVCCVSWHNALGKPALTEHLRLSGLYLLALPNLLLPLGSPFLAPGKPLPLLRIPLPLLRILLPLPRIPLLPLRILRILFLPLRTPPPMPLLAL